MASDESCELPPKGDCAVAAAPPATQSSGTEEDKAFEIVRNSEHDTIKKRRGRAVGVARGWSGGNTVPPAASAGRDPVYDTVGVALSGGGIRSAAFCLGALQALEVAKVYPQVDYLSTVSGGGYIGASLSAALSQAGTTPPNFPFPSTIEKDEPPVVQHLRDYSNYLIPHGPFDVLQSAGIYFRGLAANVLLVLPWLLLAAAVTVLMKPSRASLSEGTVAGVGLLPNRFFALTAILLGALFVGLVVWGLWKSAANNAAEPEIPGFATRLFGWSLILIGLVLFCEIQPFVISALFDAQTADAKTPSGVFVSLLHYVVVALTPVAAFVGFFGNKLGAFISKVTDTADIGTRALAMAGKIAMALSALIIPLLLWVVYLQLSYWGIWLQESNWSAASDPSMAGHTRWLAAATGFTGVSEWKMVAVYGWGFLILLLLSAFLAPNANSLHRLYRDRLSKAFLVCPVEHLQSGADPIKTIDKVKLGALSEQHSPYHLINAALNVQASKYANRRGRNADFFLFSRNYIGSATTGYVETELFQQKVPELDLATAMAVSGAAASSNMGSSSVKKWTFSLAMLNVRLGYWVRNPRHLASTTFREIFHYLVNPYFLYEMFGLLNENRWYINLSDGGHIENLGVYQLLRRRCHLIIVVDAEADAHMNFGSLVTLERYARIDLGARIALPWNEIRSVALETNKIVQANDGTTPAIITRAGPHCAVGKIYYPGGEGRILYVKSSMTGDENDYVMDYKRRNAEFPHETTGDQFFTEEQFEAYRALGFHAVNGVFSKRDNVAAPDKQLLDEVVNVLTNTKPDALPTVEPGKNVKA